MLSRSIFALLIALTTESAWASGRLPPEPLPARAFADFAACLGHLRERAAQDQASTRVPPIEAADGSTRRKVAHTPGVRITAPEVAEYDVRTGFEERVPDRKAGFLVTHFSYEETRLSCSGAVLTGTLTKGFTLPGYETLPGPK